LARRWPCNDLRLFLASAAFIDGMLTSAAAGVFPYVPPSVSEVNPGLTVFNSAPAQYGLKIGLAWWIPGLLMAAGYVAFVYRRFAGKVTV
jgi:cytochrome bd ubiquinol oxidase subunit II